MRDGVMVAHRALDAKIQACPAPVFRDRLMVGLQALVLAIYVRIVVPENWCGVKIPVPENYILISNFKYESISNCKIFR